MSQDNSLLKYKLISSSFFKNREGEPFELTDGQAEIFKAVYESSYKRVAVRAITQYGKSDVASQAIILRMVDTRERVLIIAPSIKQTRIIMGYVIEHFFDHEYLTKMIQYEGSLERLRQERSKLRITTKNGSEIMVLTADADTIKKEGKGLMGFGATIVLSDESSLIPDIMYSKVLRMVGGTKGKIVKLGNPFERNHFYRSFKSPRYHKIVIDYRQALKEGRITQDFLDEARDEMSDLDYLIFYECQFPEGGAEDALIPLDWLEIAKEQDLPEGEYEQAGLDVARFGRDKTVYIRRKGGKVVDIRETEKMDTMQVVGWVRGFHPKDVMLAIDVVGIGSGVYDRLEELEYDVTPVNVGEAANDNEKFFNKRAELYWKLRKLFRPDKNGKSEISIPDDSELIKQLSELRFNYSSERKIRIEAKDKMKERLGKSPDKADALMLAFADLTEEEADMYIIS